VSPDGSTIYVINTFDGYTSAHGRVTVVSASTGDIVKTVTVGKEPQGVAVSPDGSRLYVANASDWTVSVIATATNEVTDTIPLVVTPGGIGGYQPLHLVVSPDGSRVYVANHSGPWGLTVIATDSNTVIDALGFFDLYGPTPPNRNLLGGYDVVFSPDGGALAVSSPNSNGPNTGKVSFIDPASNTITSVVTDLNFPYGMAFSPDGSRLYVANNDPSGTVSVISMDTHTVINVVTVGNSPTGLSVNPMTGKIYVVNTGDGTMSVITP
jgi:YVTN family beta-propeller protein